MKRRALLTLSVATTLGWGHAHAQEAANNQTLEEIVVTARQRAEKIRQVIDLRRGKVARLPMLIVRVVFREDLLQCPGGLGHRQAGDDH